VIDLLDTLNMGLVFVSALLLGHFVLEIMEYRKGQR